MNAEARRHALVCAASSGLGWGAAKHLLAAGHHVTLVSRSAEKLAAARERLLRDVEGAAADDVACIAADLARADDIARVWAEATAAHPLDIIVTNAGGPPPGSIADHNDAVWHHTFDSLVMAVVRLMRLALPPMRARGWGRFIAITSTSGKEPIAGLTLSNVLRAGVAALVRTVAQEEARHGITINNICPGLTDTARLGELFAARAAKSGRTADEERAAAIAATPRRALNTVDEFGAAVAFFASEAASGVSGVSLFVDTASGRGTF